MRGFVESFQATLLDWFDRNRRDLPWRRPLAPHLRHRRPVDADRTATAWHDPGGADAGAVPLDPYAVLVSETMLQQTQVATVIPYFTRWMRRFPTVRALALADETEVLKSWEGLGYYRRARNLYNAARIIVTRYGGRLPDTVEALRELPGVGPYTAGAIASIAFDRPVPLVDGNVERVLIRLDARDVDPRSSAGRRWLWERASALVPAHRPGDFNSSLMELGATVCSPRQPRCLTCPVAKFCEAAHLGVAEQLPRRRIKRALPRLRRVVWCVRRADDDRWLIEQRPPGGRWAGLWQFPAREPPAEPASEIERVKRLPAIDHTLTHRRYRFEPVVLHVSRTAGLPFEPLATHAWVALDELSRYPLPKPHLLLVDQLRATLRAGKPGTVARRRKGRKTPPPDDVPQLTPKAGRDTA